MSRSPLRLTVLGCALLASWATAAASTGGAHQRGSTGAAVHGWASAANGVCRLGAKVYPSIRFGSAADPDTMSYAVGRLVEGISAIRAPTSRRFVLLERLGRDASARWYSIATTPAWKVPKLERRAATRIVVRYVDRLVSLGARECAVLRPRV
jgi:hypothetical protein